MPARPSPRPAPHPHLRLCPRRAGALAVTLLLAAAAPALRAQDVQHAPHAQHAPAEAATCDLAGITAPQLYGRWTLELPQVGERGTLVLSQHPEFSESLRGHFEYGPDASDPARAGSVTRAIASGDVAQGHFDLDESSDGKAITATWSGELTPGACGREIRGRWRDLDRDRQSDFVLRRLPPAPAARVAPARPGAAPAARTGVDGASGGVRSGDTTLHLGDAP